jgi:thiol-disulfide isomerase/thioredoxin
LHIFAAKIKRDTMKNIFRAIFFLAILISCKNEKIADTNSFVTFSGKITNKESDEITIQNQRYSKTISLDAEGMFQDTLKVEDGFFALNNGDQNIVVQLKNGYNMNMTYDSENQVETLTFSGLGAVTNNYFADKVRLQESDGFLDFNAYFVLEQSEFDTKIAEMKMTLDNLLSNAQGLDSLVVKNEQGTNQQLLQFLMRSYPEKHKILTTLAKGKPSPMFTYPDINGKNLSLKSLKGKYVYIDVWATWCGPCKVQIPYLKKIEKDYEDKNIAFIGLSIDTQENKDKWLKMVEERDLEGYQVMADKDWQSKFIKDYYITGIPRFILIDPEGKIVTADAPRPSEPSLLKLFDELNI